MPSDDSVHSVASSGVGLPVVWSTPTRPSRICRVIRWDSTSLDRAGSSPRGCAAVPKLKVACGSAGGELGVPEVGEGDGSPVHDVTPSAMRTAPALITVRRDVLLGTRLSPLDAAGSGACGPESSLGDGARGRPQASL